MENAVAISTSPKELTFAFLFSKYHWKEIANCPGRYTLTKESAGADQLTPSELVGEQHQLPTHQFQPKKERRDPLLVIMFPGGDGIITYVKQESGRYVHTLNTPSGMERKLRAMDIGVHLLEERTSEFE
eukprot:TRINITY_DN260_c0_g1_i3.p1 TRINITY_DN260_c0_g1~~TRINITY_DN260_c0_g1_i3.p1  ORF type:complete len:129 (+),score=29.61 TRINITY_DN260_c0_g1_i3:237-623(+)